jgi:hypothetical protein
MRVSRIGNRLIDPSSLITRKLAWQIGCLMVEVAGQGHQSSKTFEVADKAEWEK